MVEPEAHAASGGASEQAEDPKHVEQRKRARPWVKGVLITAAILLAVGIVG